MRNKIQHTAQLTSTLRFCLSSIFILSVFAAASAQDQQQGTALDTTWRKEPATPERMSQRIEEAAVEYQDYAPIPQVVFYDIGYPSSDAEYTALDGHAVMLITALSQKREELPLKRAYVLLDGKEINLKSIKSVLSEQSGASSQTVKTFGAYRADELYLLPVYLRLKVAELKVDFSRNKTGLKVATFGTEVSPAVSQLTIKPPAGTGPSDKTLEDFIKREFPGFFKK
jgi:hypothetical protein